MSAKNAGGITPAGGMPPPIRRQAIYLFVPWSLSKITTACTLQKLPPRNFGTTTHTRESKGYRLRSLLSKIKKKKDTWFSNTKDKASTCHAILFIKIIITI